MLRAISATAVTFLLALSAGSATAAEEIGAVSRTQGMSSGNVEGKIEMLRIDSSVFHQEIVSTGTSSRLEITFADGTQLTLGEKAEMTLDRFVYDPASGTGELKLGIVGAFRFISGQASKMANADVTVTTPVATVGIRGTDFWGGPIDDQFGVLLIEGAVSVSNAAGEQVLDTPGEGTNIAAPGAAPGNVTFWPQDKVTRAFATVTFQ
ncbi:MAG: FecR family protein [Propylenella sp.]